MIKVYGITETSEHVLLKSTKNAWHNVDEEIKEFTKSFVTDYHYIYAYENRVLHKRKGLKERLFYRDIIGNEIRVGDYVCVGTGLRKKVGIHKVIDGSLFEIKIDRHFGVYVNPTYVLKVPEDCLTTDK